MHGKVTLDWNGGQIYIDSFTLSLVGPLEIWFLMHYFIWWKNIRIIVIEIKKLNLVFDHGIVQTVQLTC